MGSRYKKIIATIPIQNNISISKKTLVECWLSKFHPQYQDNGFSSSSVDRQIDLPVSEQSNEIANKVDAVLIQEVNDDSVLTNTVTANIGKKDIDNVSNTTDSEMLDCSNDAEIVSSNVSIIDAVPQNTLVKNMLNEDTISNNNSNEDFSATDGSDYKPPHKKRPRRLLSKSARSASSTSDPSSSSSSLDRSSSSSRHSGSKCVSNTSVSESFQANSEHVSNKQARSVKESKIRTRNPSQWQKNQKKYLKNTGQAYISTRGKVISKKTIRPPCSNTCRLSCSTKFTKGDRSIIFKTFWDLASFQRQREFLASCVKQVEPEFRTIKIKKGEDVNRKCRKPNTSYFLINRGEETRVCKTFLLNTLAISDKPLRTVSENKFSCKSEIPTDKRGKHGKQSKLETEVIQSVRDHINSIPRVESHYFRANSSREYIDGGLTVAQLHRNYRENRTYNNKQPANYDAYHRIFNTQFNITFFNPRKHQCEVCEDYKNAVDKKPLAIMYNQHLEEKCLSRLEKKQNMEECKNSDNNAIIAIFGLQEVLPCPIGQSSVYFFKNKINCYNFTVSNIKDEKSFCFFWHEGLGKRGINEIGSCLYTFLKECSSNNPNSDIIFFSDNCCGQQKNKFILSLFYYAVSTLPIKSITNKFLICRKIENESGSIHSIIEKNIRRAKKSGPIYTPDQYISIIRNSRKTGNSFVVNEMNFNNFYDLKLLSKHINLNTAKNCNGEPISISDIKVVRFVKDSDTYKYKTTYKTELWNEAKIKVSSADKKNVTDISLSAAYYSKLPIANDKRQDIRQLITDNIVPRYYENIYNTLFE